MDYDRKIKGKGTLIQVYHPEKEGNLWEYENEVKEDESPVPAGYEVRVVSATVQFV